MGTADRSDPHLDFLDLADRLAEDLALHNLRARERVRETIAWLEERRARATGTEDADIAILIAQCHDALHRLAALRDTYQDVRAVNAASHAEHVAWVESRLLAGTRSPEERRERRERLDRLSAACRERIDELRDHSRERRRRPESDDSGA